MTSSASAWLVLLAVCALNTPGFAARPAKLLSGALVTQQAHAPAERFPSSRLTIIIGPCLFKVRWREGTRAARSGPAKRAVQSAQCRALPLYSGSPAVLTCRASMAATSRAVLQSSQFQPLLSCRRRTEVAAEAAAAAQYCCTNSARQPRYTSDQQAAVIPCHCTS